MTNNGSTITLTPSSGSAQTVTVPNDNTTYNITNNGSTITLTPSSGQAQTITVPNDNTTYNMTSSGSTITLTPSSGQAQSVTVPDNNTTYSISGSGSTVTLTGSDGSTSQATVSGGGGTTYGMAFDTNDDCLKLVSGGSNLTAFGMLRQKIIQGTTVAANTTYTSNAAIFAPALGYKIIGVVGYNFNDTDPDTPGAAGVAHFNVFAIEPHSTNDNEVYVQFRNESNNNVQFEMYVTVLYVQIPQGE